MDRPFSCPPSPSEAPYSLIRTPFTGSGKVPLARAKGIAGASRPGSLSAARPVRASVDFFSSPLRAASRAARVARSRSCSSLAISSCRSSDRRPSCAARSRSAVSAFSTSACCFWRCSVSAVSCAMSSASVARLFSRLARSAAISLRTDASAERSLASASTSLRISGSTAPNRIAERTDCSASSGVTSIAGGGLRPMRCSAASTLPMRWRRASSDARRVRSFSSSGGSRCSPAAICCSTTRTRAAMSMSWRLSLRRSSPI